MELDGEKRRGDVDASPDVHLSLPIPPETPCSPWILCSTSTALFLARVHATEWWVQTPGLARRPAQRALAVAAEALLDAARCGDVELLRRLADGFELTAVGPHALLLAAEKEQMEAGDGVLQRRWQVLRFLVRSGVDVTEELGYLALRNALISA